MVYLTLLPLKIFHAEPKLDNYLFYVVLGIMILYGLL